METLVMDATVLGLLSVVLFAVVWVVVYLACSIVDRWTGFPIHRTENVRFGVIGVFAAVSILFVLSIF